MGRALCIADTMADLADLPALMARDGHEVTIVSGASAGLAALQDLRPDIVVCEVSAAGVDGYRVLAEIRALPPALAVTPVVMVVESQKGENRWQAVGRGADDVADRSLGGEYLAALVDARLRRSTELRDALSQCNPYQCPARFHAEMSVYNDVDPMPGTLSLAQLDGLVSCDKLWWDGNAPVVMVVEVDRFAAISATLGGEPAEELMRAVAERMRAFESRIGLVTHLASRGFAALLPPRTAVASAEALADDIRRAMASPFMLGGRHLAATVSIGVTVRQRPGGLPELIAEASAAAQEAAARGGNRTVLFRADDIARTAERLTIAAALRHALTRNEFHLVYQPRMRLADGAIVGVEALLRWSSCELGTIGPAVFIASAEEHGFVQYIEDFAFSEMAGHLSGWRAEEWGKNLTATINLSARQLRRFDLAAHLTDVLGHVGLEPAVIELDIPEIMLAGDDPDVVDTCARLKASGFQLCMDDFGAGFSSLSYLHRLPLDVIKIDRSFVHGLPHTPVACGVVDAVVAIAARLRLDVVAEGVETREQLDFLQSCGVRMAQGVLLAPPMAADEFRALMSPPPVHRPAE